MLVKEDGCVENNGFGELTPHTLLNDFPLVFLLYKTETLLCTGCANKMVFDRSPMVNVLL